MMIHEITEQVGRNRKRKRIGRGESSGWGKTAGRGHKGAASRAGYKHRPGYEGGQMPFTRRIPKRGFNNARFRTEYHEVNLKSLEARLEDGAEVDSRRLVREGLIRDAEKPVKILGEGEITKKFTVHAAKFSASARRKIEEAGGTVHEHPIRKWTRPDRKKAEQA